MIVIVIKRRRDKTHRHPCLFLALIPFEIPERDAEPYISGYEYDRYTLKRPYYDGLREKVAANIPAWLEFAKREEYETIAA